MKPGLNQQPASEASDASNAQVKGEPSSPLDEQVVNAFNVFGSDLPDEAFDAVFERISWNTLRWRAPTDARKLSDE